MNKPANTSSKDTAWATINTPLTAEELIEFCYDIERLFRINPMLNFSRWQMLDTNRYHFCGQNISQKKPFDFDLRFTVLYLNNEIEINYDHGIKSRTTFFIDSNPNNKEYPTKLTITDYYDGLPEETRTQQLHLVDKSITTWATYLQDHLLSWKKWSHIDLWRWFMHKIWLPMKPAGRRISAILFWITFFEVSLILLGVAIYFLEYD